MRNATRLSRGEKLLLWLVFIAAGILIPTLAILAPERPTQQTSRSTVSRTEVNEKLALVINLAGELCAEVRRVKALDMPDSYEVTCTLFRGGDSTTIYVVNARSGAVIRPENATSPLD